MPNMKAWVYRPDSQPAIRLEEARVPTPGAGDVLVRVHKASVCGTDETLFNGTLKRAISGVIPGHEFCGEVIAVGDGVESTGPGEFVAVESHYSFDGSAEDGIIGLWPSRLARGGESPLYHGGFAEYACIPAQCAHRITSSVVTGDFWPSLFEPTGNDYLVASKLCEASPRCVAVFGCGPHGLYTQVFLRHFGVETTVAFEIDPLRRQFAQRLECADAVLDPRAGDIEEQIREATQGEGFDAAVDVVGKDGAALEQALTLTRDGGYVVLFGVFSSSVEVAGRPANNIIFQKQRLEYRRGNRLLHLEGVTGREGVWKDLIRDVSSSQSLQQLLMKPTTVVGPLDLLGDHVRRKDPGILKAAFTSFGSG